MRTIVASPRACIFPKSAFGRAELPLRRNIVPSPAHFTQSPAKDGDGTETGKESAAQQRLPTDFRWPLDWVEAVGNLRFPLKADHRLQELMDRNNEGVLQPSES